MKESALNVNSKYIWK